MTLEVLELEEIRRRVSVPRLIQAIEEGFVLYSEGRVVVPPVGFLNFDEPPGDVHIKYGYVKGDDVYVLKVASGFYDNPQLGVPFADGVLLVFSQKTGHVEFVLHDECWLTDMRTAAAGAVAARHLAPRGIEAIGIVGTGTQARLQLELLHGIVDARRAVIWGRNSDKVAQTIDDATASAAAAGRELRVEAASDLDALCGQCRLIVTTTSSREPLIHTRQLREGTHITAMGSDDHGKQEFDAGVLERADLVVADSVSQCVDHGECGHAVRAGVLEEDDIAELGSVIAGSGRSRTDERQITVADLTGVAIQDIQAAKIVCGR